MTPERLAEIKQTWEAKNLPLVRDLLLALEQCLKESIHDNKPPLEKNPYLAD